jgi:hypothetical protein
MTGSLNLSPWNSRRPRSHTGAAATGNVDSAHHGFPAELPAAGRVRRAVLK